MRMSNPIIIVGAAGGIGSALSRRLAAQGAKLHLVGRNAENLASLAAETGATSAVADVMDRAALEAAVKAAGPAAAGLAYCVGSINLKPVARVTDEDAERDFALNALGALRAVQAAHLRGWFSLPPERLAQVAAVTSSVNLERGFARRVKPIRATSSVR